MPNQSNTAHQARQLAICESQTHDEVFESRRVKIHQISRGAGDLLYAIGWVGDKPFTAGLKASAYQTFARFQAALAARTGLWAFHPADEDPQRFRDTWRREVAQAFERGRGK